MPLHNMALIYLIYGLLCLLFAYVLFLVLPKQFRYKAGLVFMFLFLLSLSLFALGMLVALVVTIILVYHKPVKESSQTVHRVSYPDYQRPPSTEHTAFGEGSGYKFIARHEGPKSIREKMLLAINQAGSKQVNTINALALQDDIDEVRLYAQSLIEKQEKQLTRLSKELLYALEKTTDPLHAAYYKKQMAEILWEQVYKYLVNRESLNVILDKMKQYAKEALAVLQDDKELPLLLCNIALRQSELKEAESYLKIAEKNQAPHYKVCAYFAELAYLEKEYFKIPKILASCQYLGVLGLQSVTSFWVNHD